MLTNARHIPATRITPADLLPDVGGLYRHLKTGRLVTLSDSIHGRTVRVDGRAGATWMHWETFWNSYIHANAGAAG